MIDKRTVTSLNPADGNARCRGFTSRRSRRHQCPAVGDRWPAFHRVPDQLLRPRHDLVRPAADFKGVAPWPGGQGRVAVGVLLVLRLDADPDGRARGSRQPSLAVCRGIHAVVCLSGTDRILDGSGNVDRVSYVARHRRSRLSAGGLQNREPALPRLPSAASPAVSSMPERARDW